MEKLDLSQASTATERENFRKLDAEFRSHPILAGDWKKFALEFDAAGTLVLKHRLGYKPLDLIETFNSAGATFSSFTAEEITITTTGAGTVRFLLGRMG